jgi:hypothetical protein
VTQKTEDITQDHCRSCWESSRHNQQPANSSSRPGLQTAVWASDKVPTSRLDRHGNFRGRESSYGLSYMHRSMAVSTFSPDQSCTGCHRQWLRLRITESSFYAAVKLSLYTNDHRAIKKTHRTFALHELGNFVRSKSKHGIPTTVGGEGCRITEFFNFRSANSSPKTTRPHGFESVHSSGQVRLHRIESCSLPSCDPCHPPHLRLRSGILDQRRSAAPMVLHSAAHQGAIQPADALKAS